ncbi:MAG: hypothetical protein KAT05_03515 [Spirochaetes bacterium]|nr:hypothetical protein [Spirochaetota bacterium]
MKFLKKLRKKQKTPKLKKLSSLPENQKSQTLKFKIFILKHTSELFFIGLLIIVFSWWHFFFPNIGLDSSQWVLSALIQSLSAILGLLIVIYVFISSKKSELIENLSKFEPKYHDMLISPTEDGTPFIIKLQKEFFENITKGKFDKEIKGNPFTIAETDYLEEFYSTSVLAEYMVITHQLNYKIQKFRDDLESIGYFEKRGKKLFRFFWIGCPLMVAENFFYHLFSLPVQGPDFERELVSKIHEIQHEYSNKDNIPTMRFRMISMGNLIDKKFIILSSFIFLNIIGELFTLSITSLNSFDYMNTKILIGIFISSGLIVFLLLFYYIYYIINNPSPEF